MFHAIEILKTAMKANQEACFDLSEEGDPVGAERAGYIADDCSKALEILQPYQTKNNEHPVDP